MTTISNYIRWVKPLTIWGAIGIMLLQIILEVVVNIPISIGHLSIQNASPVAQLLYAFFFTSILGATLVSVILVKIYCKPLYPLDMIQVNPTPKKLFIYVGIFMIGYSIFRLGSVDRILEILPIGDLMESAMESEVNSWNNAGFIGTLIMILEISVLAPLFEEFLFRGIILTGLNKRYSAKTSILISAFLFGAMHLNLPQFFNATILGLFLGVAYYYTRNLWVTIFMHGIYNFSTIFGVVPETIMEKVILFLVCVPIGIGTMYYASRKLEVKRRIIEFNELNAEQEIVEIIKEESPPTTM